MSERTINAPVEVDLGNGKLKLLFDMEAMIAMEEAGMAVNALEEQLKAKPFGGLRQLLAFGARRAHPDIKLEEISGMVDLRQMDRIAGDVTRVLGSQLPETKENPPAPPAAPIQ